MPILRLADLASMYTSRLQQLGVIVRPRPHNQIKRTYHKQRHDILLAYRDEVGKTLKKAHQECCDDKAMHLARAANVVRKAMFHVNNSFN